MISTIIIRNLLLLLCPIIQLSEKWHAIKYGFKLAAEYDLKIHVSDACSSCYNRGGLCELGKEGYFNCSITPITKKGIGIRIMQKILVLQRKEYTPKLSVLSMWKVGTIGFPFTSGSQPLCGLLPVNCDETPPTIQLPLSLSGKPYEVINISHTNSTQSIRIKDFSLLELLNTSECQYLINFTLPYSPFISFKLTTPNLTLFKCNRIPTITSPLDLKYMSCGEYDLYYNNSKPAFASVSNHSAFGKMARNKVWHAIWV
ncbi:hypothetical protein CFP56_022821 [Quercus suber]|uniref:Uncharacterized protein n=1 Tax=Quercus suber TaxID=58331 RepID=A0AAW0KC68_QUESU